MKIWILFGGWDYDSTDVLAVFSSREEAEALKKWGEENKAGPGDFKRLRWGFDSLWIEEREVGEISPTITMSTPSPIVDK